MAKKKNSLLMRVILTVISIVVTLSLSMSVYAADDGAIKELEGVPKYRISELSQMSAVAGSQICVVISGSELGRTGTEFTLGAAAKTPDSTLRDRICPICKEGIMHHVKKSQLKAEYEATCFHAGSSVYGHPDGDIVRQWEYTEYDKCTICDHYENVEVTYHTAVQCKG